MMKVFFRAVLIVLGLQHLFAPGLAAQTTWYPDAGDFYYTGFQIADSWFKWHSPGGWSASNPGYEHDFAVSNGFFESCTSWTTLPDGYSDCPTAGVLDPGESMILSVGSYDIDRVVAHTLYIASWCFVRNESIYSAQATLYGQEVRHVFCPFDSPWCMAGVAGHYTSLGSPMTLIDGNSSQTVWGVLF